ATRTKSRAGPTLGLPAGHNVRFGAYVPLGSIATRGTGASSGDGAGLNAICPGGFVTTAVAGCLLMVRRFRSGGASAPSCALAKCAVLAAATAAAGGLPGPVHTSGNAAAIAVHHAATAPGSSARPRWSNDERTTFSFAWKRSSTSVALEIGDWPGRRRSAIGCELLISTPF